MTLSGALLAARLLFMGRCFRVVGGGGGGGSWGPFQHEERELERNFFTINPSTQCTTGNATTTPPRRH